MTDKPEHAGADYAPGSMVLLTRISRFVYRQATPEILGMKALSFIALTHLRTRPGIGQKVLSEALMIDANQTVLLLNSLEERGLAERRRDPDDRRRHAVFVTPAGLKALEQAERGIDAVETEVLGRLSAAERETLRDLLDRALNGAVIPEDPEPGEERSVSI